jgi:hypothetical protein
VRARVIACWLALAVALATAPAAAAKPSTRAQRVAAANAFAHRTLTFASQQTAARRDGARALAARRGAAQDCLSDWQAAPPARNAELGLLYFEYLSGALWSVDAPLYRHWITDLRRSARIDRSPVLARAADALRRQYGVANAIYPAVPDACAAVGRWSAGGWTDAARPALLTNLDVLVKGVYAMDATLLAAGGRQLVRYGRRGKAAAKVLLAGVDEPDARVNAHTGCDAVGALVLPDDYKLCSPA